MTALAPVLKPSKRGPFARSAPLGSVAWRTDAELPAGICGRVQSIAMIYDTPDSYGTMFAPGCMDQTRQKVAAGKVKLFMARDEGYHQYGTGTHVGTVRSLITVGNQEIAVSDIFDTEAGRSLKEYLTAVTASGGQTGNSIGFYPRASEEVPTPADTPEMGMGSTITRFLEIELEELSITPINAVPGAEVLAVRASDPAAVERAVAAMLPLLTPEARARIMQAPEVVAAPAAGQPGADEAPTHATDEAATDAQRIAVLRSLYSDPRRVSCLPPSKTEPPTN